MADKKYVLDTMAFMQGLGLSGEMDFYTVPGVENELRGSEDRERFDHFRDIGLVIQEPTQSSLDSIIQRSGVTGDDKRLSDVDISLLALALDLDAVIVTDDYSIQNMADELSIGYMTLTEQGIKKVIIWELRCTGCGRVWDKKYDECPVCGLDIKTKVKRTRDISD